MDEAALIENLGNDFVQDLIDNRLNYFHNLLLELEKSGCDADSETYEELFRRFHGAKGTGGIFGMYCISTVFHQLESSLALFKAGHSFDSEKTLIKMRDELDLVEKMARAWLGGERDLRRIIVEHKIAEHKNESALILEPLKSVSDQIIAVLHDSGYETCLVKDGVQAMQSLFTNPCDLFITSEQNKYINGSELIGIVKLTPRLANIRTIYLTTDTSHKWPVRSPDIVIRKDSQLLQSLDAAIS